MNYKRVAGGAALLALALVLAVPIFAAVPGSSGGVAGAPGISADTCRRVSPDVPVLLGKKGGGLALWLSFGFLAFGLTITPLLPANEPVPKNSYAASVAVLAADASPATIPHELNFTPTILRMCFSALGSATAGATGPVPTITADGTNIYIAHATGANTGFTASVEALRPTTNNAP